MKPIEFKEQTCVYAKDQPEYLALPALKMEDGMVISKWQLAWPERWRIFRTGILWLSCLTFNKPLQPIRPDADCPFEIPKEIQPGGVLYRWFTRKEDL